MGEKEQMKAMEEVTRRNVTAAVSHGNETRKLVKDLESKVDQLQRQIRIQDNKIEEINKGLLAIRAKIYQGGTEECQSQ